ncbi:hypothetical protein ACLB90_13920 [Stenotrophomonas sp. LGBM10]|uniref:hypothetical protein n=1 Tax=Stenotrophomonas sp. LGBM10 TaxID=3390038 RepID=UPI00398B3067
MRADREWLVFALYLILLTVTWASSAEDAGSSGADVYIEFLWSKPEAGALARQETRSFVLGKKFNHQVCVAVLRSETPRQSMVLEAVDSRGEVVSRQSDESYSGKKRCYAARLPSWGVPGTWSYRVYLDGESTFTASRSVEVAMSLKAAKFNQPSPVPYVLGRPNYPEEASPQRFVGRLVWVMTVDAGGKVTHVEIEAAEGIGEEMKERALAAGYISRFPVDSRRPDAGIKYRRAMNFRPD